MSVHRNVRKLVQEALKGRAFNSSSTAAKACPGETIAAVKDGHRMDVNKAIDIPARLLMGPGPSNAYPRVLNAMAYPLLGHLHPPILKIMDECQEGLRYLFQTESKYTCLISGTGHAGMEACLQNSLERGETLLVGSAGIWGTRIADMGNRMGFNTVEMVADEATSFDKGTIKAHLEKHRPAVLFLCQGESSTGVHQSLEGLGDLCHEYGTLLAVDTVCSLGGVPMFADEWGVDIIYSGSQKCLSGPSGAAPFFMSERAMAKLQARQTPVQSFMLDAKLFGDYWGWFDKRSYHHTGVISTFYAMREALAIVSGEGMEQMWKRHEDMHQMLWEGLTKMGLKPYVENPAERLATVNTIRVPEGVDFAKVIGNAMEKYSVEIAGGLGPSAGKVWRIGVMGANARPAAVQMALTAMEDGLKQQKFL